MLRIRNEGQNISATNYFRSILAREGLVVLSPNAGAVRLLLPQQLEHRLSEIQHSNEVIISRGPWFGGCNDDIELLFDDNSNNPSCMYISEEQCMTVPEPGVWDFTVWTESGGEVFRRKARCRKVPKIPYLRPWNE